VASTNFKAVYLTGRPSNWDTIDNRRWWGWGYGEKKNIELSNVYKRRFFGYWATNVGFIYKMEFSVGKTSNWKFRFGLDFGWGGVAKLDGQVVKREYSDVWWAHNWNHDMHFNFNR